MLCAFVVLTSTGIYSSREDDGDADVRAEAIRVRADKLGKQKGKVPEALLLMEKALGMATPKNVKVRVAHGMMLAKARPGFAEAEAMYLSAIEVRVGCGRPGRGAGSSRGARRSARCRRAGASC